MNKLNEYKKRALNAKNALSFFIALAINQSEQKKADENLKIIENALMLCTSKITERDISNLEICTIQAESFLWRISKKYNRVF